MHAALQHKPQDAKVLSNRATAYLQLQKWRLCIQVRLMLTAFIFFQDCDQSILVDPTFVEPQLTGALALKGLGRLDEAGETYRRILDIHACPEAVEGLARLSKGLGGEYIAEVNMKQLTGGGKTAENMNTVSESDLEEEMQWQADGNGNVSCSRGRDP